MTRKSWGKDDFLIDAKNKIQDDEAFNILSELYDFTETYADKFSFGTGSESGSVTFKFTDNRAKSGLVSIFTIWSGGKIRFRFANIRNRIGEKYVNLYYQKLKKVLPSKKWNENILNDGSPGYLLKEIFIDKKTVDLFKKTIKEYVNEIKNEK